jgi:alpha-mannosidase
VDHRLRARIPLGVPDAPLVAGGPFGPVLRPAVSVEAGEFPLEQPVATAPAQRYVAGGAAERGLAVLAPGFFEYEWAPPGDVVVTLVRAVGELSRDDLPTRAGHAAWPQATPLAQCPGRHRMDWALLPVGASALERGDVVERAWEDAFLPLQGVWWRDAHGLTGTAGEVALEGDGLVLSAVKPARVGAGLVLRCFNAGTTRTTGAWRFGDGVRTVHRVRADERESRELTLENRGRTVRFIAEAREIVTLLVT